MTEQQKAALILLGEAIAYRIAEEEALSKGAFLRYVQYCNHVGLNVYDPMYIFMDTCQGMTFHPYHDPPHITVEEHFS